MVLEYDDEGDPIVLCDLDVPSLQGGQHYFHFVHVLIEQVPVVLGVLDQHLVISEPRHGSRIYSALDRRIGIRPKRRKFVLDDADLPRPVGRLNEDGIGHVFVSDAEGTSRNVRRHVAPVHSDDVVFRSAGSFRGNDDPIARNAVESEFRHGFRPPRIADSGGGATRPAVFLFFFFFFFWRQKGVILSHGGGGCRGRPRGGSFFGGPPPPLPHGAVPPP